MSGPHIETADLKGRMFLVHFPGRKPLGLTRGEMEELRRLIDLAIGVSRAPALAIVDTKTLIEEAAPCAQG